MKNKILIILIVLGVLFLLGGGAAYFITNNNSSEKVDSDYIEDVSFTDTTIDETQKELVDNGIYQKAFDEFYKYYPEDYKFTLANEEDEIKFSIKDLNTSKGYDASFLEEYNCDLENSLFTVGYMEGQVIISLRLECNY